MFSEVITTALNYACPASHSGHDLDDSKMCAIVSCTRATFYSWAPQMCHRDQFMTRTPILNFMMHSPTYPFLTEFRVAGGNPEEIFEDADVIKATKELAYLRVLELWGVRVTDALADYLVDRLRESASFLAIDCPHLTPRFFITLAAAKQLPRQIRFNMLGALARPCRYYESQANESWVRECVETGVLSLCGACLDERGVEHHVWYTMSVGLARMLVHSCRRHRQNLSWDHVAPVMKHCREWLLTASDDDLSGEAVCFIKYVTESLTDFRSLSTHILDDSYLLQLIVDRALRNETGPHLVCDVLKPIADHCDDDVGKVEISLKLKPFNIPDRMVNAMGKPVDKDSAGSVRFTFLDLIHLLPHQCFFDSPDFLQALADLGRLETNGFTLPRTSERSDLLGTCGTKFSTQPLYCLLTCSSMPPAGTRNAFEHRLRFLTRCAELNTMCDGQLIKTAFRFVQSIATHLFIEPDDDAEFDWYHSEQPLVAIFVLVHPTNALIREKPELLTNAASPVRGIILEVYELVQELVPALTSLTERFDEALAADADDASSNTPRAVPENEEHFRRVLDECYMLLDTVEELEQR